MKFKRILAAVLSALMLCSMMVFTASANTSLLYTRVAHGGIDGFSGEAVTGTRMYDAEEDIVYYHFVPKASSDWMHFGWHNATDKFTWSAPMTVGMIVRTNKEGAVPQIRLCDRSDANNRLTIQKDTAAIKGDGTWEIVWFSTVTAQDMENVIKNGVEFDGLTHVQCFPAGTNLVGNDNLDSDIYFDVAGYGFFTDTAENLASVDLYEVLGVGAPDITLTFDAQNGTEVTTATVKSGAYVPAKIEFPAEPTAPEGKVFSGWAADANAASGALDIDVPETSTTYYAIWAQDSSEPGDVTLASLKIKGTNATLFGAVDLTADPIVINVPYSWNGDLATDLEVVTTDNTAVKTVTAGTFGEGSTVVVKNGSATATYNIVYNPAKAGSKSYTPTGVVTSNPTGATVPYNNDTYTVKNTRFTSSARAQANAEIAGDKGTKLYYNTKEEVVIGSGVTVDEATKTINGNASYFTIASDAQPSFEGGGAYGFVTMSDYPWARVKYYLDAGEDGKTVERAFAMGSTSWNNNAAAKGYAESTKKNTAVASKDPMVSGRWAYAYLNFGEQFAEDYGFTYQFHFRPFNGTNFAAKNVMEVSADDSTVAVPHSTNGHAILFDDAFYLASVELFNEFPGTEDGLFEQIAPYAGLFTVTDETELGANDGTISGLTTDMEYRLKGAEEWTIYTNESLAGEVTLAPGTYEIRYIEMDGAVIDYAASPATEVTIKSALAAKPEVTAVNATAVDKNDGKITGVDSAMSYRVKGAAEWTAVAADATEITGLAPAVYEVIYLADGEERTEDSEITTVTVLVDFEADHVVYLTNNAEHADTTTYDGSSYEKAYAITKGADLNNAIIKNVKVGESTTFVVIDRIDLGGWNENVKSATASKIVFTGLTSDALIGFACCNSAAGTDFSMQHFGYCDELVFENITIDQICLADPASLKSEHGLGIAGPTKVTIADTVKSGANASRVRIYAPQGKPTGSITIGGGVWEGVFSGPTYATKHVTSGAAHTVTLNGGDVYSITATRHQNLWAGSYNVEINGGNVRANVIAGSLGGAFAGDAYVEINGGTINTLYTTAKAERQGNNTASTDLGIKNGASVVVVNDGTVKAIAKGADAPGGSALIVGKDATIPELTGAEADYVITVANGGKVEAVLSEATEYTYQPVFYTRENSEDPFTAVNNGAEITYKASQITGFKVTLPENYNTVTVNGEIVELTDGVLALDALSKDAVNMISFQATWLVKGDLNGGSYAYDENNIDEFFENGIRFSSTDVENSGGIPNTDDVIKPYRSGYTLAGWALKADATPEECVEFPYMITGDTTFYAIWVEANDTPFAGDETALEGKNYLVYSVEAEDVYEGFTPIANEELGEIEYLGAFGVKIVDAATGEENTEVSGIPGTFDASDIDLEGKLLYIENAVTGGILAMDDMGNGKYELDIASGIYQVYTLDPIALYTLEGTYYAKRGEYTVDVYLDSPAVNAGSIGLGFACMEYVEAAAADGVQFIDITDEEAANEDGFILITWGVQDATATIGGDGKVHIATLNFTMDETQREWFLMLEGAIGEAAMEETDEIYDGENYLVAEHKVNELGVKFTPAVIADLNDTVGPDDMVTVKGTVVMTAREDGSAPVADNYATLYWRHKGAASWNSVVIEDADTNTSVVEYTLNDVPADTEIEIYVEKNGYLTAKAIFTFEAATEEETEEKPERTADAIEMVAGDLKGDFEDACGDGKINIADFVRVIRGFDEEATDEYKVAVDINEDGEVNVTDLGFVKANFGKVSE